MCQYDTLFLINFDTFPKYTNQALHRYVRILFYLLLSLICCGRSDLYNKKCLNIVSSRTSNCSSNLKYCLFVMSEKLLALFDCPRSPLISAASGYQDGYFPASLGMQMEL